MSTAEQTTYIDTSAATDAADAVRIRGVHNIGWPSDVDRRNSVGWLAGVVEVDDIGDGRRGVMYGAMAEAVMPFVSIDDEIHHVYFSDGNITEAAWGQWLAALKTIHGPAPARRSALRACRRRSRASGRRPTRSPRRSSCSRG